MRVVYPGAVVKGIAHPKKINSVINYSPSCQSKPVKPSFIFGTQIKIFLMHSESSLTLYRQHGYYHTIPSSAILEHNQHNQHCLRSVDSTRMLNVNSADYVDYILGYSPKWRKTVTRGEELLNKLCYYCFLCAKKVFS